MKKSQLFTIVILAFVLSSCNFPGDSHLNPEGAMATEISRILTGTPIQIEPSATLVVEEVEPAEDHERPMLVEPTEADKAPPEIDAPEEPEEQPATPEPVNTPTPTPTEILADSDPIHNLGDPNWIDNMNNADNWPTGLDLYSAIKFEDGFLKLKAGTNVDGWRVSWNTIANFYLETALQTPECEGNDHFGLMFRVPADSQAKKGYLFGVTCDGRYSLRRWDGVTMHSLIGLTEHKAINKGAGIVNKLGVMARGADLALYINGQKVNELSDSSYLEGKFGIFVGGINVDDLTVWVDHIRYWNDP